MAGRRLSEIHAMIEARLDTARFVRVESERLRRLAEQMDDGLFSEISAEIGETRASGILAEARQVDVETADRVPGCDAIEFVAAYYWNALEEMGFPVARVVEAVAPEADLPSASETPSTEPLPAAPHVRRAPEEPDVAPSSSMPAAIQFGPAAAFVDEDPVIAAIVAASEPGVKADQIPEIMLVARNAAEVFDWSPKSYDDCRGRVIWKKKLYRGLLQHFMQQKQLGLLHAATPAGVQPPIPTSTVEGPSAEVVPFGQRAQDASRQSKVAAFGDPATGPSVDPGTSGPGSDGPEIRRPPTRSDQVSGQEGKVRDLRLRAPSSKSVATAVPPQSGGKRVGLGFDVSHKPKEFVFAPDADDDAASGEAG